MARDTVFIYNPSTKKKERVGKLLLEISVRELHNQLIQDPKDGGLDGAVCKSTGKVLISDSTLQAFLPPQLQTLNQDINGYVVVKYVLWLIACSNH